MRPEVRYATRAEVPALAAMIGRFADEAMGGLRPDQAQVRVTLAWLVDAKTGYVSVLDDGAPCGLLVGAAGPSPWVSGLVADEMVWWIAPERRGRWARAMLADFENWARALGARAVGVSHVGKDAGRFYARMGYLPVERKQLKVFG